MRLKKLYIAGLALLVLVTILTGCVVATPSPQVVKETVEVVVTVTPAPPPAVEEKRIVLGNGVVGTLAVPTELPKELPAVLLLHGFGSTRDEVGNMYARLAAQLAQEGIASLRIDFLHGGESAKAPEEYAETTIDGQVTDAVLALEYLRNLDFVDQDRIGLVGFSLGGGVSIIAVAEHPAWVQSMVTWSSVGDFEADFAEIREAAVFETDDPDEVAEVDLGWRVIHLKRAFFESMEKYDLLALIGKYNGAYLTIAGSEDFSADYVRDFVAHAGGRPAEALIIGGADHIYQVLTEDQTRAERVIEATVDWFARTLMYTQ